MKGSSLNVQTMFHVLRCSGCQHLMTAPDRRHHVLCPVCGVTNALSEARIYVSCQERSTAEDIIRQLTPILAKRRGRDLTEEEVTMLRQRFEAWERHTRWS